MNRMLLTTACALSLLACQKSADPAGSEAAPLSAPDLADWGHVLVGDVAKKDVWSVDGDVIVCKGEPLGYLETKESYQDFKLSFEWRWPEGKEPGNSGVLFRIQGEPFGFMPKCVEAQLKSGSAGDLWAFFGAKVSGERPVEVKGHETLKDFHGVKAEKNAEKPVGQWNQYEITCKGDAVELKINGKLVNRGSGLEEVSGPIGFQSEGAEIHFRNIVIEELK